MLKPEVLEFARLLVQHVRDTAIRNSDQYLNEKNNSPVALRWRGEGQDSLEKVKPIISDSIDEAVFHLLYAIDQGILQLTFTSPGGKTVNLTEEGQGELSGWYMGSGGWREMYSVERVFDDFSDLV